MRSGVRQFGVSAGLITQKSLVQIQPPLPLLSVKKEV